MFRLTAGLVLQPFRAVSSEEPGPLPTRRLRQGVELHSGSTRGCLGEGEARRKVCDLIHSALCSFEQRELCKLD